MMNPHSTGWMSLPPGVRAARPCFVGSDAHGDAGLLSAALGFASASAAGHELVLLGDLINRGPDPLGCVRLALSAKNNRSFSAVRLLMGNHEHVMADYAAAPGPATAESLTAMGDKAIVRAGEAALPLIREYAAALEPWAVNGGLALCHAIPDPGRSIGAQTDVSLYWNKGHQEYKGGWAGLLGAPCLLVHGHIRKAPLFREGGLLGVMSGVRKVMDGKGRLCCDAGTPFSGEFHLYEFVEGRVRCHVFVRHDHG